MADDNTIELSIDGKAYKIDPDDLEFGEVELLEDTCDAALEDINFNRAKAIRVLVYIVKHREDASFTIDDALKIKLRQLDSPDEPESNGKPVAAKRPTKAAKSG